MSKYPHPIFRNYLEGEDDKPYYTMNSLAFYYEDMERKQKLIESLAKSIAGYDIRLTENLEVIEQEVDKRLADWDKQLETFPASVEDLLTKWTTDGTIDQVIQTALIDEKIAPLSVQLAEKVGGAVKAKMEDLDDEVISAVTGGATVTVLSIPQDKSVTPEKLDRRYSEGEIKSNLIDNSKIAKGKYINTANGNLATLSTIDTTGFMPAVANGVYSFTKNIGNSTYGFYNSIGEYISGGGNSGSISVAYDDRYVLTVPDISGVAWIKLSGTAGRLETGMFVEGDTLPAHYEKYEFVPKSYKNKSIEKNHLAASLQSIFDGQSSIVTLKVKKDGTGDYTSLRQAIDSIADAGETKIYRVEIYEDTYNIFDDYTTAEKESSTFEGLFVPDYTYLKGIGKRENIIIHGELPIANTKVSTLNLKNTSGLENLTVTSRNLRYTVHDDYADRVNNGYERRVKNCVFKKANSAGTFYPAYGAGCMSGGVFYIEDNVFEVDFANPFSMHNNTNFTKPAEFYIRNNKFRHPSGDSIVFGSMGSGTKEKVHLEGNDFIRILLHEEQNNGVGNQFVIDGHGNSEYLYNISVNDGKKYFLSFSDDSISLHANSGAITKGMAVKRNGMRGVAPTANSTDVFYGVAMEDIVSGGFGTIKTKGYIKASDVGIATLNAGDKVGFNGSSLVVVTTGAHIGVCDVAGYFRIVGK